jgi:hypothetical protein
MTSKIKVETLTSKIEFMVLALGGKPDADVAENKKYLNELETTQ